MFRTIACFALSVCAFAADPRLWIPAAQTSWQWQLTGTLDLTVNAEAYDVDLFETPEAVVAEIHSKGRKAICYMSAGSYEPGRPDSAKFTAEVKGRAMDGWPDEKWLDIRRLDILGPIMEARLDLCKQKGFDAVEPDNVDGYANRTGFPLTAADQIAYNKFLAQAAHARGLSVGLKNDVDQIDQLVSDFDWALNEECFTYHECSSYKPFLDAAKAVFQVEYEMKADQFCSQANALNFNSLQKKLDLGAFRVACRETAAAAPSIGGVTNAASYTTGGVSPGEIIVVFGQGMGPSLTQATSIDLPTSIAGTKLWFDDVPAQLIYVSDKQLSAVVPASVRGKRSVQIKVDRGGSVSAVVDAPVKDAVPGIFTLDSSGTGQAAAVNQDGTVNGLSKAAPRNSIVVLYATGLASGTTFVKIGGKDADVLYAGGVSWGVPGLFQINARIPDSVTPGAAIPVIIESASTQSPAGVTIVVAP